MRRKESSYARVGRLALSKAAKPLRTTLIIHSKASHAEEIAQKHGAMANATRRVANFYQENRSPKVALPSAGA